MASHITKLILSAATAATLGACGGTTIGDTDVDTEPDAFLDPVTKTSTVNAFSSSYNFYSGRRATPDLAVLPIGTANYSGQFKTGLSVQGDNSVNGLHGNMNIRAELLGAGDRVTGTLSNIHTLNGNTPVELLSGTLNLGGTLDDGTKSVRATISGNLTGHMGNDEETGALNVLGRISGHTRDRQTGTVPIIGTPIYSGGIADSITGSISGDVTGSEAATFSGNFYVDR
jgi:hypothetical protein